MKENGFLQSDILENLPMAITVQDKNFKLRYQNKFAKKLLNTNNYTTCYHRFKGYENFGKAMCKDCPLQITQIDNQSHSILRKMIHPETMEELYFEIKHQPILNSDNTFDHFIEIVNQLSEYQVEKILRTDSPINSEEEMYFCISNFGDMGGEIHLGSINETFKTDENINDFLLKLSQFWFIAISQGENWPSGFFGPLPVFDHDEYDSYAYSFRINNKNLQDKRFKGKDVGLLVIIVRKNNLIFLRHRANIHDIIDTCFEDINELADISQINFDKLKFLINNVQKQSPSNIKVRLDMLEKKTHQ